MPLNIAIQMDPPQSINPHKDSTFVLGLEAQRRGHSLHYYNTETLKLQNGRVFASCAEMTFKRVENDHVTLGDFEETNLTSFDIILMRNDFNDPLSYTAMTHILDHITDRTVVLNNPTGTRESPEKMLITHFPDLAPPTLITRNLNDIKAFQTQHPNLILK
ncbi:MAG: glutathione synthase, partial [Bdellovibrionales bacterium]